MVPAVHHVTGGERDTAWFRDWIHKAFTSEASQSGDQVQKESVHERFEHSGISAGDPTRQQHAHAAQRAGQP